MTVRLPQEIIRRKRDGGVLDAGDIDAFVRGIADGGIGDAQVGAFAMAVVWRGMDRAETVALTRAMVASGVRLDWRDLGVDGPHLDKHSTGGIGDLVSLVLGPMLAACGAVVPMISGRGLGHTGGTLDKLESHAGYQVSPSPERLRAVLRDAGVAIVGADARLAPADRRLYAIRDVTATVDCIPLITASILSKKLAAGLDALVLDVKTGSGAFMPTRDGARELARSLVAVGCGAGLPTRALVTDMSQPLAPAAGNALEVAVALRYLTDPAARPQRLHAVVLALGEVSLCQGGLAADAAQARARLLAALDSGEAAERYARMVAGLGGPADARSTPLPTAPERRVVPAPRGGRVAAIDTRALGLAVVALGGGRTRAGEPIDPSVGLAGLRETGDAVAAGEPLAEVHARTPAEAEAAVAAVQAAYAIADEAAPPPGPVLEAIEPE